MSRGRAIDYANPGRAIDFVTGPHSFDLDLPEGVRYHRPFRDALIDNNPLRWMDLPQFFLERARCLGLDRGHLEYVVTGHLAVALGGGRARAIGEPKRAKGGAELVDEHPPVGVEHRGQIATKPVTDQLTSHPALAPARGKLEKDSLVTFGNGLAHAENGVLLGGPQGSVFECDHGYSVEKGGPHALSSCHNPEWFICLFL
jgi:hypothetical protein